MPFSGVPAHRMPSIAKDIVEADVPEKPLDPRNLFEGFGSPPFPVFAIARITEDLDAQEQFNDVLRTGAFKAGSIVMIIVENGVGVFAPSGGGGQPEIQNPPFDFGSGAGGGGAGLPIGQPGGVATGAAQVYAGTELTGDPGTRELGGDGGLGGVTTAVINDEVVHTPAGAGVSCFILDTPTILVVEVGANVWAGGGGGAGGQNESDGGDGGDLGMAGEDAPAPGGAPGGPKGWAVRAFGNNITVRNLGAADQVRGDTEA